jgi:hypothetical protein
MPSKKYKHRQSKKDDTFQDEKAKSTVKFKDAGGKYKMCLEEFDWLDDFPENRSETVALDLLTNASSIRLH